MADFPSPIAALSESSEGGEESSGTAPPPWEWKNLPPTGRINELVAECRRLADRSAAGEAELERLKSTAAKAKMASANLEEQIAAIGGKSVEAKAARGRLRELHADAVKTYNGAIAKARSIREEVRNVDGRLDKLGDQLYAEIEKEEAKAMEKELGITPSIGTTGGSPTKRPRALTRDSGGSPPVVPTTKRARSGLESAVTPSTPAVTRSRPKPKPLVEATGEASAREYEVIIAGKGKERAVSSGDAGPVAGKGKERAVSRGDAGPFAAVIACSECDRRNIPCEYDPRKGAVKKDVCRNCRISKKGCSGGIST
jgi:hypothetical protein